MFKNQDNRKNENWIMPRGLIIIGFFLLLFLSPLIFSLDNTSVAILKTVSASGKGLFANDPIAEKILQGEKTINMFDYYTGICYPDSGTNSKLPPGSLAPPEPYGGKILSALRALGYSTKSNCDSWTLAHKFMYSILQFQKDHGLPYSNLVDAEMLMAIKKELAAVEKSERKIAKQFPCYPYLAVAPKDRIAKEHVGFLYQTAMSAFPKWLQIRDTSVCFYTQNLHQVAQTRKRICAEEYYHWYDQECRLLKVPRNYNQGFDDYTALTTWLHEYTHVLDGTKVDTEEFYDISYDVSDKIDGFYRMRPKIPQFPEDGEDTSSRPEWAEIKEHFFSYADGWQSDKYPGYFTAAEDFAVSVEMYVLHGSVFRDYMEDKVPLKRKYDWIKKNVFAGKEFISGDLEYKKYSPDLYFPPDGIVDAAGYISTRPLFKYDFKPLKATKDLVNQPSVEITYEEASETNKEIREALLELIEMDRAR